MICDGKFSALLFLLHSNDLPSIVGAGTSLTPFADDALIYRIINNIEDQITLRQALIRLELWSMSWDMVFNPSKCYMMDISRVSKTRPICMNDATQFLNASPAKILPESFSTMT